jgi:hypothetical protein
MTDIIVKIMAELLSVLALATKQINQGRFSKCALIDTFAHGSTCDREVCKKIVGGQRDRGCTLEIRSIDPGRGSDDCCTNLERGA